MPDCSIITCISRPEIYEECLLKSVNECRGKWDIEIVPILNLHNLYSASVALNLGIDAAKSDILIFTHQDVSLVGDWFDNLMELKNSAPVDMAVLGSAGIDLKYGRQEIGCWGGSTTVDTVAVGTVWDVYPDDGKKAYWQGSRDLTKVHCIDECLFVIDRRTNLRFDTSFTGFHFYGVDMCLQARAAGYSVYGANLPIVHHGKYSDSFTGDKKYWVYLRHLHHKWRWRFPELFGTHMHWADNELSSYIPINLKNDLGAGVTVKAMGLRKAKFQFDKNRDLMQVGDESTTGMV